jgi:FG-GAP-like repeat
MEASPMNLNGRTWLVAAGLCGSLLLLFGFQNCAPALPLEGQASVASSARPTATPGVIGTPNPNSTPYAGYVIDGTCSDDVLTEPMASRFVTSQMGSMLAFTTGARNKAALWKVSGGNVIHGVVCSIVEPGVAQADQPWSLAAIGDFNGDQNPDILWRHKDDSRTAVWLMNGANRTQTAILPVTAANILDNTWNIEGVGSFDGDGRQDILWRNRNSGALLIWSMNGISAPVAKTLTNGGVAPTGQKLVGLADYDGNFRSDLLFVDPSTGADTIWFTDTAGTSVDTSKTLAPLAKPGTTWDVKAVGDFNGDGRGDILVQARTGGALEVRLMNGPALYAPPTPIQAPVSGWDLQFGQDVDSNFTTDWIWKIPGSGEPFIGFTPLGSGGPGTTRTLNNLRANWDLFRYSHAP